MKFHDKITPEGTRDVLFEECTVRQRTQDIILKGLCEKGFLSSRREGRNNLYTPLVSKDRYLEFESRSVLKRLYGGSLGSFVAALNAEKPLEQSEIDELRQFLDDMSR